MMRTDVAVQLRTLCVAAAGGVSFAYLDIPGGHLSGSILACAAVAISGFDTQVLQPIRNIALVMLGIIVGTSVTAETLNALPQWPLSLMVLALAMAGLIVLVPRYLNRMHGIDRSTARLSSVPGAVSLVMALADELAVDRRRVAVLQSLRLATLMIVAPLIASIGLDLGARSGSAMAVLEFGQIALVSLFAGFGYLIARQLRVPAAALTGAMLSASIVFGSGAMSGRMPEVVVAAAFVILGASVGARFSGVSRVYLAGCLRASGGGISIAVIITGLLAWPAAVYLDIPFMQMWLAIAPGGFDTMLALAIALGADPAFVAGHQLMRLLGLFLIVPFLFRDLRRAPR